MTMLKHDPQRDFVDHERARLFATPAAGPSPRIQAIIDASAKVAAEAAIRDIMNAPRQPPSTTDILARHFNRVRA